MLKNFSVVIFGEHDLRQDPERPHFAKRTIIGIEEIKLHEDYSKTFLAGAGPNDIALIRVKEPIPFFNLSNPKESNTMPICLPWSINDPGREIYDGNRLKVLGWGRITNSEVRSLRYFLRHRAGAGVLQQLVVPGISRRTCKEYDAFKNIELDLRFQLCAGGEDG